MKYQVEIYENDELIDTPEEEFNKEEYIKIAKELGLEGLTELLDEEGIIPFHRLSDAEKNIWFAYCPGKYNAKDYKGFIPIRVLGILKICVEKKYFDKIWIRTESKNDPDPILLGKKGDSTYLIARWGESLNDWKSIVSEAKKKMLAKLEIERKEQISYLKNNLRKLQELDITIIADKLINGLYVGWEWRID